MDTDPREATLSVGKLTKLTNPIFVIVYDTQGVPSVADALGVPIGEDEGMQNGVAWFRLSNYLPDGDFLIDRLQEAVKESDWVFLHTGCSICPEPVFELFEFMQRQAFETPRVVVVGEQLDVRSGDKYMSPSLFGPGVVDLT